MARKLNFEQLLIVLPRAIEERLWVLTKVFFNSQKKPQLTN